MKQYSRQDCEFLRHQSKQKFDRVRSTWIDCLRWGMPYKAFWLMSQTEGERKNNHIVDGTHILALRSFVAGFLEGNSSATRPWFRIGTRDGERDDSFAAKEWLQHYTDRVLSYLSSSNFYHAAGNFYADYGVVNTGSYYVEELEPLNLFFHVLIPGSYYVLDNSYGEASILVREFSLNVKAVVDTYGKTNKNGKVDWSNISDHVKKLYNDGNYSQMVDIAHVIKENPTFDPSRPEVVDNQKWIELTYELGTGNNVASQSGTQFSGSYVEEIRNKFLKIHYRKRKPFIVGKSTDVFEYGEKGPTVDSLGLIKSLNKKAISKDQALEQILKPALQGPASLRKSYISHAPNTFVPLDARSIASKQKLEPIFQVNPAIGTLLQDVGDLRQQVDKFYYADYLLYLTKNPKTRTATEANAIVEEQQRIIGPNLQSLNLTHNIPVVELVMDYVLYEDPFLRPPPPELEGKGLVPDFISIFAQAQKAADLPSIDRYAQMIANVAQMDPKILQKINTDKLADLYEDRLYLPAGLNNPQGKVDAMREQAQREAKRQQAMEQTIPALAKAAKDASALTQGNE